MPDASWSKRELADYICRYSSYTDYSPAVLDRISTKCRLLEIALQGEVVGEYSEELILH